MTDMMDKMSMAFGQIGFIQIDGNTNALITQGLPWATMRQILTKPGLGDDARQDLRSIANGQINGSVTHLKHWCSLLAISSANL